MQTTLVRQHRKVIPPKITVERDSSLQTPMSAGSRRQAETSHDVRWTMRHLEACCQGCGEERKQTSSKQISRSVTVNFEGIDMLH